jgi:hypothetical protein
MRLKKGPLKFAKNRKNSIFQFFKCTLHRVANTLNPQNGLHYWEQTWFHILRPKKTDFGYLVPLKMKLKNGKNQKNKKNWQH